MQDVPQWLLILIPTLLSGLFGGAVATWIKTRPEMKKAELQGEAALWKEIGELKADAKTEREECEARIARIEERHAVDRDELKLEIKNLRHHRNNVRQAFNALLAMLRQIDHPELPRIVAAVEDMIARGEEIIATEIGALTGAKERKKS